MNLDAQTHTTREQRAPTVFKRHVAAFTSRHPALMMAAMNGHAEILPLLLDHGGNANERDKKGNAALSSARLETRNALFSGKTASN